MSGTHLSFFILLKETFEKDIEKLKKNAEEGEEEYNRNIPPIPTFGPKDLPTTIQPYPTHYQNAISQPSRSTIPLAIILLTNVELIGNLISKPYSDGFQHGAKLFFSYAGLNTSIEERELLRGIFRNGLMHVFFPKGPDIGITYDSSLETRKELFIEDQNKIILNVNFLCNLVLEVLKKISNDNTTQQTIENNVIMIAQNESINIQKLINDYKIDKLKRLHKRTTK